MRSIGLTLLENYPKRSQDLNPIEAVWKLLRDRLGETVPTSADPREAFAPRLRQAVAWINRHHRNYMLRLCRCQKAWAREVLEAELAQTSREALSERGS